ncbi:hypothetical protein [Flavobacterium microcysteis]
MVAMCQFKMPEKLKIAGKSLDDETTRGIIDKIVDSLKSGKAELYRVESFCDIESQSDAYSEVKKEPATFIEIILILDEHQIQDYKIYDALITDKALQCLQDDENYISRYWINGNQEHIGFETEF